MKPIPLEDTITINSRKISLVRFGTESNWQSKLPSKASPVDDYKIKCVANDLAHASRCLLKGICKTVTLQDI